MEAINLAVDSDRPPALVRSDVLDDLVASLVCAGYRLTKNTASHITLARSFRSASVWALSLLTLPAGLITLALLRREATIDIVIGASPAGGTWVTVAGQADGATADEVRRLRI